jgi:superoxide dismutase, Fe-Mn family
LNRREMLYTAGAAALAGSALGSVVEAQIPGAQAAYKEGRYTLPPLPYAYDALEPHIDELTMSLHHGKHHASYVAGLNNALAEMARARKEDDFALVKHWEREAAFHGSGHFLHTIFWENMSPKGGGKPTGTLAKALDAGFGSFDAFRRHFSAASNAVEGSGWGLLVYEPIAGHLRILQAEKHQNLTQWGVLPLLVLDVWEHAYYLKYQNRRPDYISAWWNVVNWPDVERRYSAARR